jgi:tRNA-modifying protein YgfZ
VLDLGDELLLDTERVALQPLFNMIRRYKLGMDVELHKRTLELGLLSLIGPQAERFGLESEHANRRDEIAGQPVVLVRTDVGVDVFMPAEAKAIVAAELGVPEVEESAAEIVRVEHGRPRWGVDLDESVIPQEAGLNERAVSFTKGCYVGQETVARLYYRGKPNRHLRGLRLSAAAETGAVLRLGEKEVGRLGSVVVSPRLGPIALAIVRREAAPGDTLLVGDGEATAEVVEVPFEG